MLPLSTARGLVPSGYLFNWCFEAGCNTYLRVVLMSKKARISELDGQMNRTNNAHERPAETTFVVWAILHVQRTPGDLQARHTEICRYCYLVESKYTHLSRRSQESAFCDSVHHPRLLQEKTVVCQSTPLQLGRPLTIGDFQVLSKMTVCTALFTSSGLSTCGVRGETTSDLFPSQRPTHLW